MNWINVNDRLPEEGQRILIWDNEGVDTANYTEGQFEWQGLRLSEGSVTHWMHLPQPPNENTPNTLTNKNQ